MKKVMVYLNNFCLIQPTPIRRNCGDLLNFRSISSKVVVVWRLTPRYQFQLIAIQSTFKRNEKLEFQK